MGFRGSLDGKESACNVGDLGLISGLRRSPEEGSSYPIQCSCLENSMDRGDWGGATVHGVTKSWTLLSDFSKKKGCYQRQLKCESQNYMVSESCLNSCLQAIENDPA